MRPYLDGDSYKSLCETIRDERGRRHNPGGRPGWTFVKTDYLPWYRPDGGVLVTGHSSYPITDEHAGLANCVETWYAPHCNLVHPAVVPVPIGLADARYSHGNQNVLQRVRDLGLPKTTTLYANFNADNNPNRTILLDTLRDMGIDVGGGLGAKPYEDYLRDLKAAKFAVCPCGTGPDSHRISECILMGTLPICRSGPWLAAYDGLGWPIIQVPCWDRVSLEEALAGPVEASWDTLPVTADDIITIKMGVA